MRKPSLSEGSANWKLKLAADQEPLVVGMIARLASARERFVAPLFLLGSSEEITMTELPKSTVRDDVLFDPKPQPDEHPEQRAILHAEAEAGAQDASARDEPADGEDSLQDQARREQNDADRQERLLDEGVEETFPASDPVSVKRVS